MICKECGQDNYDIAKNYCPDCFCGDQYPIFEETAKSYQTDEFIKLSHKDTFNYRAKTYRLMKILANIPEKYPNDFQENINNYFLEFCSYFDRNKTNRRNIPSYQQIINHFCQLNQRYEYLCEYFTVCATKAISDRNEKVLNDFDNYLKN